MRLRKPTDSQRKKETIPSSGRASSLAASAAAADDDDDDDDDDGDGDGDDDDDDGDDGNGDYDDDDDDDCDVVTNKRFWAGGWGGAAPHEQNEIRKTGVVAAVILVRFA